MKKLNEIYQKLVSFVSSFISNTDTITLVLLSLALGFGLNVLFAAIWTTYGYFVIFFSGVFITHRVFDLNLFGCLLGGLITTIFALLLSVGMSVWFMVAILQCVSLFLAMSAKEFKAALKAKKK